MPSNGITATHKNLISWKKTFLMYQVSQISFVGNSTWCFWNLSTSNQVSSWLLWVLYADKGKAIHQAQVTVVWRRIVYNRHYIYYVETQDGEHSASLTFFIRLFSFLFSGASFEPFLRGQSQSFDVDDGLSPFSTWKSPKAS